MWLPMLARPGVLRAKDLCEGAIANPCESRNDLLLGKSWFVRFADDIRRISDTILRKPLCLLIVVKQAVWPALTQESVLCDCDVWLA